VQSRASRYNLPKIWEWNTNMKSPNRARARRAAQEQPRRSLLLFGGIGLIVVVMIIVVIASGVFGSSAAPLASAKDPGKYPEEQLPDQGRNHIDRGQPHEPYISNPPASGSHYGDKMVPVQEGFYDEANRQIDEDVVHSMEHGYVIIWYDCTKAPNQDCGPLKEAIKRLMKSINGGYHLIGNPRDGQMDTMIALTSWTKLRRLETFDADAIKDFISRNLNQSPEPGGP
jgi:uncharacterized protein DUF3105